MSKKRFWLDHFDKTGLPMDAEVFSPLKLRLGFISRPRRVTICA
jgi:hypothetical protein